MINNYLQKAVGFSQLVTWPPDSGSAISKGSLPPTPQGPPAYPVRRFWQVRELLQHSKAGPVWDYQSPTPQWSSGLHSFIGIWSLTLLCVLDWASPEPCFNHLPLFCMDSIMPHLSSVCHPSAIQFGNHWPKRMFSLGIIIPKLMFKFGI